MAKSLLHLTTIAEKEFVECVVYSLMAVLMDLMIL